MEGGGESLRGGGSVKGLDGPKQMWRSTKGACHFFEKNLKKNGKKVLETKIEKRNVSIFFEKKIEKIDGFFSKMFFHS